MSTGIRIGELCALQWKDIDLEKRILTVKKTMQRIQCPTEFSRTKLIITNPKSESSQRKIPIPDCMMHFLLQFKGKDEDFLLTGTEKPIEPRAKQYRFRTILKNAKLPSVHFHALRHMFASNCIKLSSRLCLYLPRCITENDCQKNPTEREPCDSPSVGLLFILYYRVKPQVSPQFYHLSCHGRTYLAPSETTPAPVPHT